VLQLVPCDFELSFGALVIVAIHARVLNKNVQAVYKRARGGGSVGVKCRRVVNGTPLKGPGTALTAALAFGNKRLNPTGMYCTLRRSCFKPCSIVSAVPDEGWQNP